MITDKEMDEIREAQETFMPQRIVLKRREFFGDNESEYKPFATNVPARLTAGFGIWRNVADRYQGVTAFTLTVPWDQDVHSGDIAVDGTHVYEIRDVKAPNTYQSAKQCLCDQVSET